MGIVGAGITGLSIARTLRERGASVVVLERSGIGAGASGVQPGGVRQQWGTAVNCRLARESVAFYRRADELLERTAQVQGLHELTSYAGVRANASAPQRAAAVDFILEGLYAQKKISRSDEWQYQGAEPARPRAARPMPQEPALEREIPFPGNKKKYYN